VPKAARRAPVLVDGVVMGTGTALRAKVNLWHKRVNMISGAIVLLYGHGALPRATLRSWVKELRMLADEMEKQLK
jgi:hypothetical protein